MKIYNQFHGNVPISEIGKELRKIIKIEKTAFKIMTGYGSTSGKSESKIAAIKSLSKMKKENLINGFLPGEIKFQLLNESSPYYNTKMTYERSVCNDSDYGNEGIIFVFVR